MSTVPGEALLYSLLLGVALGILCALFRAVCILLSLGKYTTAFADILFCLAASVSTFLLALAVSHGRLRFFQAACQLFGFFCVKNTVADSMENGLRFCLDRLGKHIKNTRKRPAKFRFYKKISRKNEKTLE